MQMRYPKKTPTAFSGAQRFVEDNGMAVWCELCDTVMTGKWFNVKTVAAELKSLRLYRSPDRYLRAVLKAVITDYAERPDEYEFGLPVKQQGKRMDVVSV